MATDPTLPETDETPAGNDDPASAPPEGQTASIATPASDTAAEEPATSPTSPEAPSDAPTGPPPTDTSISDSLPPVPSPDEMHQENSNTLDDMAKGHIHPKTMEDLMGFNDPKKGTLAKIGTFFSLIVGSAGAGLAKQPNMLMEAMKAELDRDLHAQIQDKSNDQNWYKLHLQQEMQNYQRPLMAAQVALAKAQASKVPAEIKQMEANKKAIEAEVAYKATLTTKNNIINSAIIAAQKIVDGVPPAAQPAVQGVLNNVVAPAAAAQIDQNIQEGAAALGAHRAATFPPPPPDVDLNKIQAAVRLGTLSEGAVGLSPALIGTADAEAKRVQQTRATAKMYDNAFKSLNTAGAGQGLQLVADAVNTLGPLATTVAEAVTAGKAPGSAVLIDILGRGATEATKRAAEAVVRYQQWREAQIGTLTPMLKEIGAGNDTDATSRADAAFPAIYDLGDEKTRKAKYDNTMTWLKNRENTTVIDTIPGAKRPFPNYQYVPMEKEKASSKKSQPKGESESEKADFSKMGEFGS